MPCVQEQARQKHEVYLQANRRDVDPYAGIDDPLEMLKIVHQPPRPDRLIRYAQPSRPTDVLYAELGSGQIAALARHAQTLLKKGDIDAAQAIAACLVAFASADISSLQQEFIRLGALRPEFLFHRAAPKIRDLLTQHLARVAGHDVLLTDKLLCALAWVGDDRVVELFAGWRAKPPQWAADLHIPPYQYSQQAGWELSPDSQRRNLYHEVCYPLIRGDSSVTASPVAVLTDTNLLELDGTSPALAFLGCAQQIVVPICDKDLVDERMPRRTSGPGRCATQPLACSDRHIADALFADRRTPGVDSGRGVSNLRRVPANHALHRPDRLRGRGSGPRRHLLRLCVCGLRYNGVHLSADLTHRRTLLRPLGLRRLRPWAC